MTFLELIEAIEEYAASEQSEPVEVVMKLHEHYIPGLDNVFDDFEIVTRQ